MADATTTTPVIIVQDHANVLVDGQAAGAFTDVLSNHAKRPKIKSILLKAFQDWHAALVQQHRDQMDAHTKAVNDVHTTAVADLKTKYQAALDAAVASHSGTIEKIRTETQKVVSQHLELVKKHEATIADQAAQIDAMGGTELGQKLAREKLRKQLNGIVAAAQARLAQIDSAEASPATSPPAAS